MSIVTIGNEFLTVDISSVGAELQSIRNAAGEEYLWQGDPAFWAGRAPIMFPVCGGLINDRYLLDGREYRMPKHGYVRQLEWTVEEVAGDRATFLMKEKHEGFPFDYELRAVYTVTGSSLQVCYRVDNRDSREFVFGIGSHEAYAVPGGLEEYSIAFEKEERLENYIPDGNRLLPEPELIAERTDTLPLKTAYFEVDALVFPTLRSRRAELVRHGKARVRVDYDGMDVLLLWTRPGAGYICIEPWTNAPDYADADGDIRRKPGMITLAPGKHAERTHTITIL